MSVTAKITAAHAEYATLTARIDILDDRHDGLQQATLAYDEATLMSRMDDWTQNEKLARMECMVDRTWANLDLLYERRAAYGTLISTLERTVRRRKKVIA